MPKYTIVSRRGYSMQEHELDISADTAGDLPADVIDAYLGGQCVALALAISRKTGWPLVAQCWGSTEFIENLGPRDDQGLIEAETFTVPEAWTGRDRAEILRLHFEHLFVLSPDGALDVRGITPVRTLASNRPFDFASAYACNCPPTCACRAACCTGGTGRFYATLTESTAVALESDLTLTNGQTSRAVVAAQNHDAARHLADLLLTGLGIHTSRPRLARGRATTRTAPGIHR